MAVFEYHNNVLCVVAEVLYAELKLISYDVYQKWSERKKLVRMRNACPGKKALVSYPALPDDFKTAIKEKIGDPYTLVKHNAFSTLIVNDVAAAVYFRDYRYNENTSLSLEKQREYCTNAEVLTAALKLSADRRAFCKAMGGKATQVWQKLSQTINELDKSKFPHTLPTNWRSLQRAASRFDTLSYYGIVHKGFGNDNSEKINDSAKLWVLSRWADRVKKVANIQQLFMEYNAKAIEMNWKQLEDPTSLHVYLHREDVQELWWGHRYGELKAKEKFGYQNKTKLPTMRDSLWYSDGTKMNYFYQKEDGTVATCQVYEIMDAYSEVLLGYCISDSEDYKTQYSAYKMAAQFAGHRPYEIGFDNQGGHKKLQAGNFLTKVAHLAIRKAPYNGKSKTIENAFSRFQQHYLKQDWFFTGMNIQTKEEESKANREFINANKANLPTLDEVKAIYKQRREQWNNAQHPILERPRIELYQNSVNELAPAIEIWDMVDIFWVLREEPVMYNAYGLTFMDQRKKYHYSVYNENGLPNMQWHSANIDKKFWIKFDPEDMTSIYLYDKDSQGNLRFVTEARTKITTARGKQEQESWETQYLADIKKLNDTQRVERVNKMDEILEQHGATAEQYGLNTPRILGIKQPKKKKELVTVPADFGEVLKADSQMIEGEDTDDIDIYSRI